MRNGIRMAFSTRARAGIATLVAALAVASCGGSGGGNNDQGVSFRAVGIFAGQASINDNQITCQIPNVENAIADTAFPVNLDTIRFFPDANDAFADPCGGYIWMENLLLNEAINVQEISVRYEVAGSAIEVPSNSITTGFRINPSSSDIQQPSGQPNAILVQLLGQILPRIQVVFLQQNQNLLPARPYFLNVYLVAKGQSDDSTNYTSNEIGYQLTVN